MTSLEALQARRARVLGKGMPLFYDQPLHLVRGEGAYLFDPEGRQYVDMYNNVPCVGHANPVVAEAIARQQATLNVHSRYLHEGIIEFAERLTALHGPAIESVIFSCSGTEANEVALRMARLATGKRGVVFSNGTYHGNSEAIGLLTGEGRRPGTSPEIAAFPFPDLYRPLIEGLDEAALGQAYLGRVEAAIDQLEATGAGVACLIVCSIFANEGLPNIPAGFMAAAAERVRAAGGLVIADEVQAGYCRTGDWWGYQATGFVPDIVVTGKPMGNGLPLAATAASQALVAGFRDATGYFNTFASSPLQAAAGMAVLDEIERLNLRRHVAEVGAALQARLAERAPHYDFIGDVRGRGLFIGIEMVTRKADKTPDVSRARTIANRLKDRGFLTSNAGAIGNVLKIRPPLVFSHADADRFIEAFDATLAGLA
ncbi:MAG: aspartate aminotransferase family protein [Gammaproteobacteria bacterium]